MKLFNMIGTLLENVGYWLLTHGPFAFKVDGKPNYRVAANHKEGNDFFQDQDTFRGRPFWHNWDGF